MVGPPAAVIVAGQAARTGFKQAQIGSKEIFGYDFVGLAVKVLFFQLVALLIAKFIETVAGGNTVIKGIALLLGYKVPNFLPQPLLDFFTNGWNGVRYWDVIKGITIAIVLMEYNNYRTQTKQLGQEPSPATEGLFLLIVGFFALITIPELYNRMKVLSSPLTLSLSSGPVGTQFEVSIIGLTPLVPARYGWMNSSGQIIFEQEIQIGTITGVTEPFTFTESVLSTTTPGRYTIYMDQTAGGGKRYEAQFEVLEGIAV